MIENATAAIAHTPAARPSTPSEKLTMFISSTSASAVSRAAEVAELDAVQERERERVDLHAGGDEHDRRRDLPGELDDGGRSKHVVERADDRDQRRGGKDAFGPLVVGQEQQARDERAAEDRQPAEQRRAPCARPMSLSSSTAPIRRAKRAATGVSTAATAKATSAARTALVTMVAAKDRRAGRRDDVKTC